MKKIIVAATLVSALFTATFANAQEVKKTDKKKTTTAVSVKGDKKVTKETKSETKVTKKDGKKAVVKTSTTKETTTPATKK